MENEEPNGLPNVDFESIVKGVRQKTGRMTHKEWAEYHQQTGLDLDKLEADLQKIADSDPDASIPVEKVCLILRLARREWNAALAVVTVGMT